MMPSNRIRTKTGRERKYKRYAGSASAPSETMSGSRKISRISRYRRKKLTEKLRTQKQRTPRLLPSRNAAMTSVICRVRSRKKTTIRTCLSGETTISRIVIPMLLHLPFLQESPCKVFPHSDKTSPGVKSHLYQGIPPFPQRAGVPPLSTKPSGREPFPAAAPR